MFKLSLILAGLAICNVALAVLMPWYVVTRLGIGPETDAFFASGALPQLVSMVASLSLTQVLVPLLATADERSFGRDSWSFFLAVSGVLTLLAALLFVTAEFWVDLLVPGFAPPVRQLTITLTRIQLFAMIGNAAIVVLWSAYDARQKFIWAESSAVLANAIGLLFLVWTLPAYGIKAAAWANVVMLALKIALLMPVLGRWQQPQWDSLAMKEAWRRIKPFLLGETYAKSDPLIDRFLTSLSAAGNLSLLYIAQQIYAAGTLIFTRAIATPSVPALAIAAKSGDWPGFRHHYWQRLLTMLGITMAAFVGLGLIGEPALRLMIGYRGITAQNVHMLWWIMMALAGLLIGGASRQVVSGAFYAIGDTRTPTRLFIVTYTIYIPVKIIAFLRYGVIGLAVVTSIHLTINLLLQVVVLERVVARAGGSVVTS